MSKVKAMVCVFSLATMLISNEINAADDLLQWCIRSYPTRTAWCAKQYPTSADFATTTPSSKQLANPLNSNPADQARSNPTPNDQDKIQAVEAINAYSKFSDRAPVLFTNVMRSGNVICPMDGISWVLAEHNGKYYALNGTARSWVDNMNVYHSGGWHRVLDGGVGDDSVFGIAETYRLIGIGNDLCPKPAGSFINVQFKLLQQGERQARELKNKYGMQ